MDKTLRSLVLAVAMAAPAAAQQFDYSPGFEPGAPVEMTPLSFLPGEWSIALQTPADPDAEEPTWQAWAESTSRFEAVYGGAFIREEGEGFPVGQSSIGAEGFERWAYQALFSWDRFQRVYRAVYADNITGLLDVYHGSFDGSDLVFTNLHTGTFNTLGTNAGVQSSRATFSELSDDRFVVTWETVDRDQIPLGGTVPWRWSVKMIYRRR